MSKRSGDRGGIPLLAFRGEWGNLAVRRIHDQRRAALDSSLDHPVRSAGGGGVREVLRIGEHAQVERVSSSKIRRGILEEPIGSCLELFHFLVGQERSACQRVGPLEDRK